MNSSKDTSAEEEFVKRSEIKELYEMSLSRCIYDQFFDNGPDWWDRYYFLKKKYPLE